MNAILQKQRRVVELTENAIKATDDELHSLRNQQQANPQLAKDLATLIAKYETRRDRQAERLNLAKRELAALEAIETSGGKPKRGA